MRKIIQITLLLGLITTAHAATFTHLHFTGLPQTMSVGECVKLSVNTTDDEGNITPVSEETFVRIGGAMGFDHFSNDVCTAKSGGFTIPAGQSSGTFYISTVPCRKNMSCSLPIGNSSITVLSGTKKAVQIITITK